MYSEEADIKDKDAVIRHGYTYFKPFKISIMNQ